MRRCPVILGFPDPLDFKRVGGEFKLCPGWWKEVGRKQKMRRLEHGKPWQDAEQDR